MGGGSGFEPNLTFTFLCISLPPCMTVIQFTVAAITLPLRIVLAFVAWVYAVINAIFAIIITIVRIFVLIVFAPYWIVKSMIETAIAIFCFAVFAKVLAMTLANRHSVM